MPPLKEKFKTAVSVPAPRRSDAVIALHGEKIPDPYNALEDLNASSTIAWLNAQEALYDDYISGADHVSPQAVQAFSTPAKGIPQRVGDQYLFYYKGANDKQPKIMISDTPEGEGRVLLEAPDKKELGGAFISPDGKYLAYRVLESGKWEAETRVKDLATGKDLPDLVAKTGTVWWDKDGGGFTYNQLSVEGPSRIVLKHHKLGDSEKDDATVFDDKNTPGSAATLNNTAFRNHASYTGDQEWLFQGVGAGQSDLKLGLALKDQASGKFEPIFQPGVADIIPVADTGSGILAWTTHNAPNGRVVLFDPKNPAPEKWQTVIAENEKDSLQHVFMHEGRLMALYNHNAAEALRVFDLQGNFLNDVPVPERSRLQFSHASTPGSGLGQGAPSTKGEDLYFEATTFTEAPRAYRYNIEANTVTPVDPAPAGPNLQDCSVEQIWATSKDGTKVPMTVVRAKDTVLDGTAALKLEGYGGFGIPQGPNFNPEMMDFVRSGGIYVQANVRGGGEFGRPWHEGGRGRNKTNMIDDFNAVAQELIAQNYTSPARLVSEGHSNGGLLVLAAMQRAPQLYGAVIAGAPVADMLSEKHPVTKREYGDPFSDREDFEAIKKITPAQNIRKGDFPPVLVRTGAKDEMLIRGALKFVAGMQFENPDGVTLLHVEKDYGHAANRPANIALAEIAAKKAFIERSIGPISQVDYKKQLATQMKPQPAHKI